MKGTRRDTIWLTTPEGSEVKLTSEGRSASAVAEIKENYISEGWTVVKHKTTYIWFPKWFPKWFYGYLAGIFVTSAGYLYLMWLRS